MRTDYPESKLKFVKGMVEDTIPGTMPDSIAMLLLDTDFYKSTKHELVHLYPRLVKGGVIIIDSYVPIKDRASLPTSIFAKTT